MLNKLKWLAACLICYSAGLFADDTQLHILHDALYNLYFPLTSELSDADKFARLEQKKQLLNHINNKQLLSVLKNVHTDLLHSTSQWQISPYYIQTEFDSYIREQNLKKIQLIFKLRKLYLSMIYSKNVANSLAGITIKPPVVHDNYQGKVDSFLKLDNKEIKHADGEIDYLIVGSGPAGCVIANQLRELKPKARILILDSGSFVMPETIDTTLDSDFIEMHNLRTTTSGTMVLRNGQAIGGGTTVNIDLAFSPLLPSVKDKLYLWAENNYIPSRFLHNLGNDWGVVANSYAWVSKKLHTREVEDSEINANNMILLKGTSTARTYYLNQKPHAEHPFILKNSATDMLLMPAFKQSNGRLSILPNSQVQKINFEGSVGNRVAKSVFIKKNAPVAKPYVIQDFNNLNLKTDIEYEIKARSIILCAGTLGSAGVLLKSNIQNDLVGRGITIHPSIGVVGQFGKKIDAHEGLFASVYATSQDLNDGYYYEALGATPSFIALIHPGTGSEILSSLKSFRNLGGFGVMLIDTPNNKNRIFIDPETKQLAVDYTLSEDDKKRFKKALMQAVSIIFKQGAKRVFVPSLELSLYSKSTVFISQNQALEAIGKMKFAENLNFITSAHMQGSNKIGANPKNSVVSHNFKVWDGMDGKEIPNLYVVDSSIFPTSVGANPMQAVYTFAKIFTDKVLINYK